MHGVPVGTRMTAEATGTLGVGGGHRLATRCGRGLFIATLDERRFIGTDRAARKQADKDCDKTKPWTLP